VQTYRDSVNKYDVSRLLNRPSNFLEHTITAMVPPQAIRPTRSAYFSQ